MWAAPSDNLDVLIEGIEKSEGPVGREFFQTFAEEYGHPGLVSAKQVRCLLLCQLAFLQYAANP